MNIDEFRNLFGMKICCICRDRNFDIFLKSSILSYFSDGKLNYSEAVGVWLQQVGGNSRKLSWLYGSKYWLVEYLLEIS